MRYNTDTCSVELSVRLLCERALLGGDLGGYTSADTDLGAMADGAEIHRKLQAEAGGYYNPEVTLRNTTLHEGLYYTVSGRADGVIRGTDGSLTVDEIKCVRGNAFYAPPKEVFLAQLKCYAYFLAVREEREEIRGRLTYYHMETKQTRYRSYRFCVTELRAYYLGLLARIARQARWLVDRVTDRLPAAALARFPYAELREGQEIMIRECYSALRRGKRLFVEAPTGTGKTVSALYPAVRALGEGHVDKIFYLTAKASTGREAYRAAGKLLEGGARLRTVMITAKEQTCVCPAAKAGGSSPKNFCNPVDCERAKGYYDRVGDAIGELLDGGYGYPRQRIAAVANRYGVCPYELSLDLSEYCDILICDYNYAFDPSVYFRRYFSPSGKRERYAFLIDEAHNLADRARDMYSAELRRSDFLAFREEMAAADEELTHAAEAALITLNRLRKLCREDTVKDAAGNEQGFYMSRSPLTDLCGEMEIFAKKCEDWLKKNREHPLSGRVSLMSSALRRYLSVNECFDRGFLCYLELYGGELTVKTYCLDPAPTMDALLNRASSAVLFSATLTPPEYFCDVLGGSSKAVSVSLPSPFDSDCLCVAVADYVSARYEDREKNHARFATVIAATVSAKAGNYIAYFPSYACLDGVRKAFCRKYPKVEVVVQSRGMGVKEREEFLAAFKEDTGHLRVGFCVLGGAFGEGVDLPGSRLIGSIIFGVGLPGLSNERNIIQEYFDNTTGQGYDYAYTYPGMNRVLQAVGRVIRRDDDRGVAVLVDDRYAAAKYRALFPKHWGEVQYAGNAQSLAEIMRRFWKNRE
ncbi:MAG: ATP-dependent DNA helicase [Clostridia bacterium]|nr:ATP-dependent DNA helicase [Clostridia bacterium]